MSDFTEAYSIEGDELQKFLLEMLERVEDMHDEAIQKDDKNNEMYYQGQKDMVRIVLAFKMNRPELNDISRSSPTNYERLNK